MTLNDIHSSKVFLLSLLLFIILFYNSLPYSRLLMVQISSCYLVAFKTVRRTHHKDTFLIQTTQHRDWKVAVHE